MCPTLSLPVYTRLVYARPVYARPVYARPVYLLKLIVDKYVFITTQHMISSPSLPSSPTTANHELKLELSALMLELFNPLLQQLATPYV